MGQAIGEPFALHSRAESIRRKGRSEFNTKHDDVYTTSWTRAFLRASGMTRMGLPKVTEKTKGGRRIKRGETANAREGTRIGQGRWPEAVVSSQEEDEGRR